MGTAIFDQLAQDVEAIRAKHWDMIVVGGGMGGAALAYSLGEKGFAVLLVEQGVETPLSDEKNTAATSVDPDYRAARGRWPTQIGLELNGRSASIWPALGSGLGGSTLLYAAALSRLEPIDFSSRILPDGFEVRWPFTYKDLLPYYARAEQLFGVSGTVDPLAADTDRVLLDPPAMGDCDRYFFQQMQAAGLHPYRLNNGIRYVKDCTECGGHFCARNCKADARNVLVLPAAQRQEVAVLTQTEVTEVRTDGAWATGVTVRRDNEEFSLEANRIALAAGSLATPLLLRKSKSVAWPAGIGNQNDLVGRNLMFHASDFVALWPKKRIKRAGPGRTMAFRDFYNTEHGKLGEFQSMGLSAGYPEILTYLHEVFDQSPLARLSLLKHLLRAPALIGAYLFQEASVFATIVEDNPYHNNRVVAGDAKRSGIKIQYTIASEFRARVLIMRKLLKQSLQGMHVLVVNREVKLNYGHACGTCRAGDDPRLSVVDVNCKVHGMDNLYVVDGSFMPTSGGVNPSLTIAANAFRVAEQISLDRG